MPPLKSNLASDTLKHKWEATVRLITVDCIGMQMFWFWGLYRNTFFKTDICKSAVFWMAVLYRALLKKIVQAQTCFMGSAELQ